MLSLSIQLNLDVKADILNGVLDDTIYLYKTYWFCFWCDNNKLIKQYVVSSGPSSMSQKGRKLYGCNEYDHGLYVERLLIYLKKIQNRGVSVL